MNEKNKIKDKSIEKDKIWEQTREKLAEVLATPAFESWIKPLKFIDLEENSFIVSTESNIAKQWIVKNYNQLISDILKEISGKNIKLKINVEKIQAEQVKMDFPEDLYQLPEKKKETKKTEDSKQNKHIALTEFQIDALKSISNNLNLKYTFETFVIGSHNKFAHAAAQAVAKAPGRTHNPLFLYGGVGLGKTHLMQAIGHHVLVSHPHLKIKYTSTESFTNDLINSIRTDKMAAFRSKYRQIDLLLIDDIQFIEGKETTQEEIFHTFNTLYESGKQIVITSDRPPKNISTLTERLRSRFEWGLLADIQVPDLETRIAILKNKADRDNVFVPDDVLELIATAYHNNIRELEGALNRVIAYVSINDCPMTIDSIRKIINFSGKTKNLTVTKIIEATAGYFSLEAGDIKGQSRAKDISLARQIAIYLTREMTGSSFPTIGTAFGGRKHTTILYAFEKIKEELHINKNLAETISEISHKITSGDF